MSLFDGFSGFSCSGRPPPVLSVAGESDNSTPALLMSRCNLAVLGGMRAAEFFFLRSLMLYFLLLLSFVGCASEYTPLELDGGADAMAEAEPCYEGEPIGSLPVERAKVPIDGHEVSQVAQVAQDDAGSPTVRLLQPGFACALGVNQTPRN